MQTVRTASSTAASSRRRNPAPGPPGFGCVHTAPRMSLVRERGGHPGRARDLDVRHAFGGSAGAVWLPTATDVAGAGSSLLRSLGPWKLLPLAFGRLPTCGVLRANVAPHRIRQSVPALTLEAVRPLRTPGQNFVCCWASSLFPHHELSPLASAVNSYPYTNVQLWRNPTAFSKKKEAGAPSVRIGLILLIRHKLHSRWVAFDRCPAKLHARERSNACKRSGSDTRYKCYFRTNRAPSSKPENFKSPRHVRPPCQMHSRCEISPLRAGRRWRAGGGPRHRCARWSRPCDPGTAPTDAELEAPA
jgi:hypothetical protein